MNQPSIIESIRDYHTKNIRLVRRIIHRDVSTIKRELVKLFPPIKIEIGKRPDGTQ